MAVPEHSVLIRPCPGERHAGDTAIVRELSPDQTLAAIVDVTGHGFAASRTATRVSAYLNSCRAAPVDTLMQRLHDLLNGSEGAAIGLAVIDQSLNQLTYTGTGNTVLRRIGQSDSRLVSRDGMVGVRMRTPSVSELALDDRDLILMYTDGITERMPFADHDGSRHQSVSRIADTLINEFGKGYDDAGCIVLRYRSPSEASP